MLWVFCAKPSNGMHCQPLVPAINAMDGEWLVSEPFAPVCKPGGHGVIWKLAYDKGVFQWFHDHGRTGATVRQVRSAKDLIFFYLNSGLFLFSVIFVTFLCTFHESDLDHGTLGVY